MQENLMTDLKTTRESLDSLAHSMESISQGGDESMLETLNKISYNLASIAESLNGILELKLASAKIDTMRMLSPNTLKKVQIHKQNAESLL